MGRAPRFLLLMPNDLRHALEKAALEGGRPLTSEINRRLANSLLDQGLRPPRNGPIYAMADLAYKLREPNGAADLAGRSDANTPVPSAGQAESQVVAAFRRLPVEKQLALLALLK